MPRLPIRNGDAAATAVVTRGRIAAAQWEMHLCRDALARGDSVIAGPEVLTYPALTERLWLSCQGPGDPALLMPRQSRALWERVIAESPEGQRLLGVSGIAAAAEDAWRRVAAYGIDLAGFLPDRHTPDFAAFLSWADAYTARLRDAGWIDRALLDNVLAERYARAGFGALPFAGLGLADLETSPAEQALFQSLQTAGTSVEPLDVNGSAAEGIQVDGTPGFKAASMARETIAVRCADPSEELEAAAEWAACAAAERPDQRFAIIVPDLDERRAEVVGAFEAALRERAGSDASERLFVAGSGAGADLRPLVGAALNALELVLPGGGFAAFSRWLRSPFWQHTPSERAAASTFEAGWRDVAAAQLPFLDAYRYAGLRDRLRARLPGVAHRIDAALKLLGTTETVRSPAAWAAVWPRVLDALGGLAPSREGESATHQLRDIEEAFREVALLTPVIGALSAGEALAELERCLVERSAGALPVAGVHVLAELSDIGPGYAGVWLTGAVDGSLPMPVRINPFLPLDVQIRQGMPWSTPNDALRRSHAVLERTRCRVPELIFSWPARIRDEAMTPSPLLRVLEVRNIKRTKPVVPLRSQSARKSAVDRVADAPPADVGSLFNAPTEIPTRDTGSIPSRAAGSQPIPSVGSSFALADAAARFEGRAELAAAHADVSVEVRDDVTRPVAARFETLNDPAPAVRDRKLPGGTSALNAQSVCPIRAFCEHRLGARLLPAVGRGLSPGMQGRALHDALERFYRRFEDQAALVSAPPALRDRAIERAAAEAAKEAAGTGCGLLGALAEIETERIAVLLKRFTERELGRAPFRIDALESEATVEIHDWTLRVRLDRIDALENDAVAVIDYKSGAGVRPSHWLGDRPRDVQLPLYATLLPQPPAALVLAVLRPERIAYAGFWDPPDAFPGRPARGEIAELIETWRRAIGRLVEEYAAGDVRIFAADREPAAGPYAPLTRVYEQPWHLT